MHNIDSASAFDRSLAPSIGSIAALICSLVVALVSLRIVYNIHLHPLAQFPGPFWARSSLVQIPFPSHASPAIVLSFHVDNPKQLWRFYHTMSGRSHRAIQSQHKIHGPVIRISPDELSFASASSWKAIYGFPPPGTQQLIKGEFYDIYGSGFKTGCIGSERDPAMHARKKKNLTAAFSVRALQQQEEIVQRVIDAFIRRIGPLSADSAEHGVNIVSWMEMVTFDILGEMAFGESFHCIDEEKHHPWIDLILKHLLEITLVDNLRRFYLLATLGKWLLPKLTVAVRNQHSDSARRKVKRRLQNDNGRQDFLTNIVSKVKGGEVSEEELSAHASTLIIAGGETTATCLAATVYYLLKTPSTLHKLINEIRNRFPEYLSIDATSAQQLPYLQAVLHESLRIYPPGSLGFPRVSPGCQIDGIFVPKGTEVYTSAFTVTHDERYFKNPEDFVPERWLDGEEGEIRKDVKEASQPFSLGYRACIGRSFAFMQMASVMAKLLFVYDLELVNEDLDFEAESHCHIMWWKAPVWIRLTKREGVGIIST